MNRNLAVHNSIVQHKFDHWKQPLRVPNNISKECQAAFKELKNDETIDIKTDDKSGCFVVADKTGEILLQLEVS